MTDDKPAAAEPRYFLVPPWQANDPRCQEFLNSLVASGYDVLVMKNIGGESVPLAEWMKQE